MTNERCNEASSSAGHSLITLPPELLHQVFVHCSPSDLAALDRTHPTLHHHLTHAYHLWKQIYNSQYDPLEDNSVQDAILTLPWPYTKSITSISPTTVSRRFASSSKGGSFDHVEQIKRRTWAEKQIDRLKDRPIDLYANYNETLRTLVSIARSRLARNDANVDHRATADYLTALLTSPSSLSNFRQLVFPRTDVKMIRHWQLKEAAEQSGYLANRTPLQRLREEKRTRSTSLSSTGPNAHKRSRTSSTSIEVDNGLAPTAAAASGSLPRRRSARVQLHAYPPELHHLLHDKKSLDPITLDDGTGLADLRALEPIDEQLAAELHVLHGIHPGFYARKDAVIDARRTRGSEERHVEEENDDESDALFVDQGTPFEPQDTEPEDDEGDEGDEEATTPNNVFQFFVDQFNLHPQPREPALGSESGHVGNVRLRGKAREIVYDTARYGPENSFGPLRAWRERWEPLDGPRASSSRDMDDDDEDEDAMTGDDPEVVEMEATDEELDHEISSDAGEDQLSALNAPFRAASDEEEEEEEEGAEEEDEEESDDDFDEEEDDDDDDDDDDDSDTPQIFIEIRAMAISHSRGLIPYHEAKQLKGLTSMEDVQSPKDSDAPARVAPPLRDVWRGAKRVDWVAVEAIMIVMYCNIRHAVLSHGWGLAFNLASSRSLVGRDEYAQRIYPDGGSIHERAWRDLVGFPCGWSHSRGSVDHDRNASSLKPYDWAGVESTWIGTYAFLDWSKWAAFNARDPISRGLIDSADGGGTAIAGDAANTPSLDGEREALGDCLQLRMELLPLEEQKPLNEADRVLSYLEGYDHDFCDGSQSEFDRLADLSSLPAGTSTCQAEQGRGKYPPLRFRGQTRTYPDHGPPIPRGELYGIVRPIYAEEEEHDDNEEKNEKRKPRGIVAIHWDITHRYDGEDAWSLSGVQPGPPGTRAPIYGTWGSAARRDNMSPCGPWTYYKVDERHWRDFDQETVRGRS